MQLLNSDSISQRDIELSQIMLDTYHRLQSSIHGDAEDTYTVHGLTHLPEQVKKTWSSHFAFRVCIRGNNFIPQTIPWRPRNN